MLSAGAVLHVCAALCLRRSSRGTWHAALKDSSNAWTRCFLHSTMTWQNLHAWPEPHPLTGACNGAQAQAHYRPGCNAEGSDAGNSCAQHRQDGTTQDGCCPGNGHAEQDAGTDASALAPAALAQLIEKVELANAKVTCS